MTKAETAKIMAILETAYPAFYKGQSADQKAGALNLWTLHFSARDYQTVVTAVNRIIATREEGYPPTIGAVNEAIRQIEQGDELTGSEAWSIVRRAIGTGIYNSRESWEAFPPEIKALVTPQQIHEWACDENFNNGVEESNFIKSYNVRLKSFRETKMLPENIRAMIAEVANKLSLPG